MRKGRIAISRDRTDARSVRDGPPGAAGLRRNLDESQTSTFKRDGSPEQTAVLVDYYDTPTPLKQLASVTCPTATQLVVDVYDKSALGDVEKGLMASDIGMTPSNDGSVIRLNVPQLTKDRRVELAKTAKGIGEGGKTALRNVRRDAIDKIKKAVKVA